MAIGDLTYEISALALNALHCATGDQGHCEPFIKVDRPRELKYGDERICLADLLNKATRPLTYATVDSSETVEVPFSHIVIVQGDTMDNARPPAARLEQAISKRWDGFIDPELGASVAIFSSPVLTNRTHVYFGQCVHAPAQGVQPVGTVDVVRHSDAARASPALPDGRPAAFYPGQTAVAFSGSVDSTPATCDLIVEPLQFLLYRTSGGRVALDVSTRVAGMRIECITIENPDQSRNAGKFFVTLDDEPAYYVEYDLDIGDSRLQRQPVDGGFAISGIVAPADAPGAFLPLIGRFWFVDVDAHGYLAAGAFADKRQSICVSKGRIWHYDWNDFAPARRQSREYRLDQCALAAGSGGALTILRRRQDGADFGYLSPPAPGRSIRSTSRSVGPEYVVEWLRTCIGAVAADGSSKDVWDWNPDPVFDFEGMSFGSQDGAIVTSRPLLARSGPDEPFRAVDRFERTPRAEFIVGPLCLRLV